MMEVDFGERAEEGKGEVVSKFLWRRSQDGGSWGLGCSRKC